MRTKSKPIIIREMTDLDDWEHYYSSDAHCGNCGEWNTYFIRLGTPKKGLSVKCDKCGCKVDL